MTVRAVRIALLVLNATAASAHAQDARPDRPVAVFVTLQDTRQEVRGELVTLTDQAVAVLVDGVSHEFPLATVRRVQRLGDGNRDGAIRGALLLGLLCMVTCGQGVTSGAHYVQVVAVNAAFGALAGWQFDRDHVGRTTLFPFPRPDRGRRPASPRPSIRFGVRF